MKFPNRITTAIVEKNFPHLANSAMGNAIGEIFGLGLEYALMKISPTETLPEPYTQVIIYCQDREPVIGIYAPDEKEYADRFEGIEPDVDYQLHNVEYWQRLSFTALELANEIE